MPKEEIVVRVTVPEKQLLLWITGLKLNGTMQDLLLQSCRNLCVRGFFAFTHLLKMFVLYPAGGGEGPN